MSKSFAEKVGDMMRRTGKSYYQCCASLGSRGGRVAAEKRRKEAAERRKQEARGLV